MVIDNTVTSQGPELSVIPYIINQSTDPQLCDSNFFFKSTIFYTVTQHKGLLRN